MVLWKDERRTGMGKRGHSEEEILRVFREEESGDTVVRSAASMGLASRRFISEGRLRVATSTS